MNKLVVGCLVVGALLLCMVVVIVFVAFSFSSGVVDVADSFFEAVTAGDLPTAYGYTSADFRTETSQAELEGFLAANGLQKVTDTSWTTRAVENNEGTIEGTVETEDASSIPIKMTFVKEGEDWKIMSITKPAAGLLEQGMEEAPVDAAAKEVPAEEQLEALTDEAVGNLALAINAGDFEKFYEYISKLWQAQTTAEEIESAFQSFQDQDIDLRVVHAVDPVFGEPPAIDEDGVLQLKGYYPSQPMMARFELRFVYEHPNWKLLGINVSVESKEGTEQ